MACITPALRSPLLDLWRPWLLLRGRACLLTWLLLPLLHCRGSLLRNGLVGHRSLRVCPFAWRLLCLWNDHAALWNPLHR